MQSYSLFEYYPVSGATIKSAAEDTRGRVTSINEVVAQLEQDHRQAVASVSGLLEESVADAPTEAITTANGVLKQAEYAASCLELFGTDIDTYDFDSSNPRSVSKLNAAYSAGLGDGFGAEYDPPADDATPDERQAATDSYTTAWDEGRRELLGQLNTEKAQLDCELDRAADAVSTMLTQGPTEANLQALWAAGVLPPYAPVLYPGVYLSGGDLPPDAQQELLQYLIDHPELLINTPGALASVIAGLPTDVRTDIEVERRMEQLRREGLLTGPNPGGTYEEWIRNTVENGVSAATVIEIAGDHGITPDSFGVLDGLQRIEDPDGKSFFVIDPDMAGDDVRAAVLMTYILNAGTDYENGDFSPTPYSSDEVQRIIDRQAENSWSYDDDVDFVHGNGDRLVTTPNGMIMGAGGNELQDLYGQQAGTTWGDIFMIGENDVDDPVAYIEQMIASGRSDVHEDLDLDRLLHHEEIHSQQWARYGQLDYMARYVDASTDVVWEWGPGWTGLVGHWEIQQVDGADNEYEVEAGLEDGGYQSAPGP